MDFEYFKTLSIQNLIESILFEAWTPEQKERMVRVFKDRGFDLIGHEVVKDYDLTLWKCTKEGSDIFGQYAVGINGEQHDPGDSDTQQRKVRVGYAGQDDLANTISILRGWVNSYGPLLVATTNAKKVRSYRRLLSRYFAIVDYDSRYLNDIFYIQKRL